MMLHGKRHEDKRGIITFNNEFEASRIKRIYTIENHSVDFVRGWQGHKIEQRWFACMKGKFEICVIKIDDFEKPSKDLEAQKYILDNNTLAYLHVPSGCITAIRSLETESKLLVLADYALGEIQDEYRFDLECFNH